MLKILIRQGAGPIEVLACDDDTKPNKANLLGMRLGQTGLCKGTPERGV